LVSSGPALAVGLGFTVSTTLSVAVPHDALAIAKCSVTVPIPETFTFVVNEDGVVIEELAEPVEPICVQVTVPLTPDPAIVNEVGPDGLV
jgi:hypothetical protein